MLLVVGGGDGVCAGSVAGVDIPMCLWHRWL